MILTDAHHSEDNHSNADDLGLIPQSNMLTNSLGCTAAKEPKSRLRPNAPPYVPETIRDSRNSASIKDVPRLDNVRLLTTLRHRSIPDLLMYSPTKTTDLGTRYPAQLVNSMGMTILLLLNFLARYRFTL